MKKILGGINLENLKQNMESILFVAQILAENGASSDRIIRTSKRIATFFKIPEENFNLQILPSILILNVKNNEQNFVVSRICSKHAINMNLITRISNFSWKILKENYSLEEFQKNLKDIIEQKRFYTPAQNIFATGFACGGFCILFNGDIFAAIYTAIASMTGKFFQLKFLKLGINEFVSIFFAAFFATSIAYSANFLPTSTNFTPLIACCLFLIPGVPIINSTKDMLGNFITNGITLFSRTILIVISMTFGIVFAIEIIYAISPINFENLMFEMQSNFLIISLAAATAAIGFSIIFNTSQKFFIAIGILGASAVCLRNFLILGFNFNLEISTFLAALLVSILSIKIKKFTQTPMQVLIIPSIIPLVPGVLIYRFLIACIYIGTLTSEEFFEFLKIGIDATQVIAFMVIGATLPQLIAGKFFDKKNKAVKEKYLKGTYGKNNF